MLSFQETMQAFLQTQQEVMAAYLRAPVDDQSDSECRRSFGLDGSEATTNRTSP